ncbi:hypothetical protein AK812_SmicGene30686 [Symbiodinium microadriaticum]|uniref:Uncharacterized protein n=1 Tax=Symbiodinium microadriaticum TaxID=2951 RepID=A0A1Q9CYK5_SYMMI|nr:hypothetical protein AK812_SmicGene30686 [Symbiodinium microadriaticum]
MYRLLFVFTNETIFEPHSARVRLLDWSAHCNNFAKHSEIIAWLARIPLPTTQLRRFVYATFWHEPYLSSLAAYELTLYANPDLVMY